MGSLRRRWRGSDMRFEWAELPVGQLGRVVTGRTPSQNNPEHWGDLLPFLTPTDMDGRRVIPDTQRRLSPAGGAALARVIVPHGVAVSCIGWQMGKAVLINEPTATNQQINSIITDERRVDRSFLYYSLRGRRDEIFRLGAGGSRTPILKKSLFEQLLVRVPPLTEQRRIAAILGALDDKIELNRQMNRTLEEMAQAIFKSWFIDFDGHDDLVDSELGPIPRGWAVVTLAAVASHVGRGISPKYAEVGGVLVLNQKCVRDHSVSLAFARRHDEAVRPVADRLLAPGDVLVNSTGQGTLGRVAPLPDFGQRIIVDSHVSVVRAGPRVDRWFLSDLLLSREAEIESLATGSTGQTELSRAALGGLRFALPTRAIQEGASAILSTLRQRMFSNAQEGATLAQLRDTLVPKLISGEIRIPEAEAAVSEEI